MPPTSMVAGTRTGTYHSGMSRWKLSPRTWLTVICGGFIAITTALYLGDERFAQAELRARDWLATNGASRRSPRHPDIVFLGIDTATETLDQLLEGELAQSRALQIISAGRPWSRELYALIAERLIGAGAKAVVFDIRFPGEREGDEAFRAVLDRYADRIVIGMNFITREEEAGEGTISVKPSLEFPSQSLIADAIHDRRVGFVNVREDHDRIVRRVQYRTTLLEFFGLPPTETSPEMLSLPASALRQVGLESLVPHHRWPERIRFSEEFLPRSLYEIFVDAQWSQPPYSHGALFRDKIVFIGASGNQAEDRIITPFGPVLGPSVHLGALNAALNHDFLHELPVWGDLALIAAAGAAAWMLGAWVKRPNARIALLLGTGLAYFFAAQLLFNLPGVELLLLAPAITLLGSGIMWSTVEHAIDREERRRIRRTLEGYVSRDVVREVLDNPASFLNTVGGVRRCITVLFSDVRGFTTITESADASELVTQLNEYFTEMVRIVFARLGTLDKFIGDAVMAHWGSVSSRGREADACQAVAAALDMFQALARLNADWKSRGMAEWKVGLGINHGEAIVGRIGSEDKHEFSAIGDPINLASRLEGTTKEFHQQMLIGESVASMVREQFVLRTVGLIQVKGKTKPVDVFTVLSDRQSAPEPAWLVPYEEGVKLYRRRAFAEAAECFRTAAAQNPDDWLLGEYQRWCVDYLAEPPDEKWDGVYVMTKK